MKTEADPNDPHRQIVTPEQTVRELFDGITKAFGDSGGRAAWSVDTCGVTYKPARKPDPRGPGRGPFLKFCK